MKLAATGFVSGQAGSVASANALLLKQLLKQGHEIDFFSKSTFVDPRPVVGEHPGFRFFDVSNDEPDRFRQKMAKVRGLGFAAAQFDAWTYNRMLVRMIAKLVRQCGYDCCLWMGDYAHGPVPGVPTVSFAQGPPGTDARAVIERRAEIRRLAGLGQAWKWMALAKVRLSRLGSPPLQHSDHVIVGSQQSCRTLIKIYGIGTSRISALPYPIDLDLFSPKVESRKSKGENQSSQTLRVLWLGRIVPRKRLDLFLDGAAQAIREGFDVRLSIVGGVGFVSGYERLIAAFQFPDRLERIKGIARIDVPALLQRHDVLAQPSDEENFGSSVAEAQACGLPVIVGYTNGNADYLCSRDIHLSDELPATFAAALREMANRKKNERWGEASESRNLAEEKFSLGGVAAQLMEILESVIRKREKAGS